MKVSFLSDNLYSKLTLLNHAISTRGQLPVLSNFLLETKEGKIKISATDLEIAITTTIPASIETEGRITVPAKNFMDLFSNLGSKKITLTLNENTLNLTGEKIKASFQTIPAEEFPNIGEEKGEKKITLKKEDVGKYFSRVAFAAAVDSSRPALSGVLLENEKNGILLVATDGYRLSFQKSALKTTGESKKALVVPARVIRELFFMKEEGDSVDVFVSDANNQVIFVQNETTLIGRLIESEYPDYEKIIPTDFSTKTEFNREELLSAIKICSVFARETANIIKLSIAKDKIIISANSPSVGEDMVEVEAKTNGEENEIAFNAKYVLDVLNAVSQNDLVFEMNGPLNSGVFKIKGDDSFLHLIMPIRVQG